MTLPSLFLALGTPPRPRRTSTLAVLMTNFTFGETERAAA